MIRVLHVVTFMGRGGLETMLMNYYRSIDRTKVQFDFLVHRDFRADYDDEIESLGGKIHRIPRLVPWSFKYRNALNNFFKTHPEYKIVHVHQDCLSSIICKSAKKNGVPVRIAHSHNNNQDKNLKYLIKLFYRHFIPKYATKLMSCSNEAGRWMFGDHDFIILPNAIDTHKFAFSDETAKKIRSEHSIDNKTLVLGHVGRFEPQKNHDFLIDIFYEVQKSVPAKLMLVGDGYLRKSIEEKVNSLGICDKLIFTGVQNNVHELLQAMDVFIFPSLYEGFGISVIEAQSVGLPCIISDTISRECSVTDLVERLSLNDSPETWRNAILKQANKMRIDRSTDIKNCGFDIAQSAEWLCDYYMKNSEG